LNEHKQPKQMPRLPAWALPAGERNNVEQQQRSAPTRREVTSTKGPVDASVTDTISGFRRELGAALFEDVLLLVAGVRSPRDIPNQQKQQIVLSSIENCRRGMQRIREIASEISETAFYAILDELEIESLDRIPSFEAFQRLGKAMRAAADQNTAA
jgi:hypothetical protein